jgi:hypothetical protein
MPQPIAIEEVAPGVERLWTVKEFALLEGMSTKTVYRGVNHLGWPHYVHGGVTKFSVAQILEIREMGRRDAGAPARRRTSRRRRNSPPSKRAAS